MANGNKRWALAVAAALACCSFASAKDYDFRDILEVDAVVLDTEDYTLKVENVLLWNRGPRFLPTFRLTMTRNEVERRMLAQPGFVWVFRDGIYAELTYGLSSNDDSELGQEGFAEITRETDETVMSARFKAGYLHEPDIFYMIPDVAYKRMLNDIYGLQAKYFLGYNTDDFLSHSLELNNEFTVSKVFKLSALAIGTWEQYSWGDEWLWGAGLKAHAAITKRLGLKYLAQYNTLALDRWAIENAITLDVKF